MQVHIIWLIGAFYLGMIAGIVICSLGSAAKCNDCPHIQNQGGAKMIQIVSEQDQKMINNIRLDLGQAIVDLTELQTNDPTAKTKKDAAFDRLRQMRDRMDQAGLKFKHYHGDDDGS